ncbi:MAG: AAA family ATPase [Deltaproteobacteria bacterium]|nr:AAA family ATPase [Deltaproteobacteria bacterium]
MNTDIGRSLEILRASLDEFVIGHDPVKEALMLALIAQEHIYMEGEPGCAKTLLAEVAGATANLRYNFCQFHRDTRLSELVGDVVLVREGRRDQEGSGRSAETIRQGLRPGGVLTAELVLLDDISRAPGEALNVLLRILNERSYQDLELPLLTSIATSNPTGAGYYNEPLDPANLDRFTLQVRTSGALASCDWETARIIIDRYEGSQPDLRGQGGPGAGKIDSAHLKGARRAAAAVVIPEAVMAAYLKVLGHLRNHCGCDEKNSLLTDRTMLVKVPRMIQAMALLGGRDRAEGDDLRVLKHILTFRVPPEVYEDLDRIIAEALDEVQAEEEDSSRAGQDEGLEEQTLDEVSSQGAPAEMQNQENSQELIEQIIQALEGEGEEAQKRQAMQQQAPSPEGQGKSQERVRAFHVENLDLLMEKISGRLERNLADAEIHPGGSPRSYRRMNTFDEFGDSDPGDIAIWMDRMTPVLPRTLQRKKKHVGGRVVVIRDVSQSMEGRYARWTSSVVTRLVELVRKKRMRIGYIEFNHASQKYSHGGRFFTRDYDRIIDRASNVTCSGVTNYQHPLKDALEELRRGPGLNRHIIFLTDGEPTQGDWLVREERKLARALGVNVHTLFIGSTDCPEILDILSEETDGSAFLAVPDDSGSLVMTERKPRTAGQHKVYLRTPPPEPTRGTY